MRNYEVIQGLREMELEKRDAGDLEKARILSEAQRLICEMHEELLRAAIEDPTPNRSSGA